MTRLGIISCCKTKLDHAAYARDLYCSHYFTLCQEWIRRRSGAREYVILSALHGVVTPYTVLDPYEFALSDMNASEYDAWCARVAGQLLDGWGRDTIYTVLAGDGYRTAVKRMPLVEDKIEDWTRHRREGGMTAKRASMGIGVIKKHLIGQLVDALPPRPTSKQRRHVPGTAPAPLTLAERIEALDDNVLDRELCTAVIGGKKPHPLLLEEMARRDWDPTQTDYHRLIGG